MVRQAGLSGRRAFLARTALFPLLAAAAACSGSPQPPGTPSAAQPPADPPPVREFPDTTGRIAVLADQLLSMNEAQTRFAATHFVGTQKVFLPVVRALRAVNPRFLVLHYHLAMWQSAPGVPFIVDGKSFGNDWPDVSRHEDWFWHDAAGRRVASSSDGKLLMNVSVPAFGDYWATSIAAQTEAGEYDAVFLDSASPALLQGECGSETGDPRLAGMAARTVRFDELGGTTWTRAWAAWIANLDASLARRGVPLIPNVGSLVTKWDDTDYGRTAGVFSEGFADPSWGEDDWKLATDALLAFTRAGKIVIVQGYLREPGDVARRRWYLANYLLIKGARTYVDYFAGNPLQWFPEWGLDLGAPASGPAASADALAASGVYVREFAKGIVLVNPSGGDVTVALGAPMRRVVPEGGGAVGEDGAEPGTITTTPAASIVVPAKGAEILLR
jgi:hypothetical protein